MSTELIINASLPETRIALMEGGEIQDLIIERATGKGIVGNIYKGRVTRVLPGMQAAFVDIGLEKAAFLYVDDVFVHSEIFDEEEAPVQSSGKKVLAEVGGAVPISRGPIPNSKAAQQSAASGSSEGSEGPAQSTSGEGGIQSEGGESQSSDQEDYLSSSRDQDQDNDEGGEDSEEDEDSDNDSDRDDDLDSHSHEHGTSHGHSSNDDDNDTGEDDEDEEDDLDEDELHAHLNDENDEDEDEDDDGEPTKMAAEGEGNDGDSSSSHPGTVSPSGGESQSGDESEGGSSGGQGGEGSQDGDKGARRGRHRRGRRGGKFRRKPGQGGDKLEAGAEGAAENQGSSAGTQGGTSGSENQENADENGEYPSHFNSEISDESNGGESDRSAMVGEAGGPNGEDVQGRPVTDTQGNGKRGPATDKQALKSTRNSDRRVPSRSARRPVRAQVNIQDLLKEGQEVLVQVAKDPIATKGARLTCHISLPGRHLVCMPTIDHVGVSRRIEKDEERRRLRDVVERNRPRNLGFIVRTASGRGQAEKRIKQDIDYLTRLWDEIREKAGNVTAPALVYEDLNSVLRAIRDWVTDDIDKIIVDSRYHYNDILRFVSHFMPSLKQKVELYHGDVPIFDAYNISTELSRALERKVWLKSGGYLVIDQAEALVAIDVNTGRYVGKKNLEDTILKTNLEAVQEIAYQLRLRNCGGIIILDLIDMEKEENKQRVYRALEEALRRDRARPTILKISELGLVEMTRKRTRDTIVRALCESCSFCEGKGFIKSKTTIAYEVLREIEREGIERDVSKILVQAHPDVIDILAIDERETLDQIERRYRKQVYLQSITESHPEQFEVSSDKKPGKQAGDFHEVLQPQKTHNSDKNNERGGERDRGRNGGRDKNRGRDQNKDQNRDASRDANREANGEPIRESIGREPRGGRDRNRDQSSENSDQPRGKGVVIPPRPSKIPQPRAIPLAVELGQTGEPGNMAGGEAPQQQAPVQVDDENYGNRISSGPVRNHQNNANYTGNQDNAGNRVQGSAPASDPDDFYDEEDRLAFLRAQATQDAALAKFRGAEASPSVGNHRGGGQNRGGQGQGEGGGRNNNRNRRGGRGGRSNQQGGQKFGGRDNQGGGGQGGGRNQGGGQNRGPRPFNQRPNQGGANAAGGQGPQPGNSTADAGGGNTTTTKSEGRGDGGGNQDGGGGDHSQPPA